MTRQTKMIDIGFQIGTGRANLETEQKVMDILSVDWMGAIPLKLKQSPDSIVDKVWKVTCVDTGKSVM